MLFNIKRVHGDDEVYMESPEEQRVHFLFILLNLLFFGKHDAASSWFRHLLSCHEVVLDYQDWISCCLVSKFQSGQECPVIAQLEYFTALNYLVCFQNLLVLVVSEYAWALEVLTLVCSSTLKFVKCSSSSKVQNFSCFFCGLPVQAHSDRFPQPHP